ncbi:MAG: hypothetical protein LC777_16070 [Actinobacteria bacterium]|nr:hypothetical protein [Actinomycetota bacterium]
MTDLEALVVAAYVFADEYPLPARCGRPPLTSDAELVALAVCQAAIGASSDRQFLGLVGRLLPGWFPHLPDQSQYNRRLRGLVELSASCSSGSRAGSTWAGARLADGSQLALATYAGCQERSHFVGFARYGYARSQHRFIWGVRLVLDRRARGPARLRGRAGQREGDEPLADLLTGTPAEVVIADKGFWAVATASGSPPTASRSSLPTRPAAPETPGASARSPRAAS